jgi:hypothetical protein
MRSVTRLALASVVALTLFVSPALADDARWSLNANFGPSFANIGTTFQATGSANVRLTERVDLSGEIGVLPHAPFDRAGELAVALPGIVPATDHRVNGYHVNANLRVVPGTWDRVTPYLTGGLGSFTSETVASGAVMDARLEERRRVTDFATNVGAGLTYQLTDRVGVTGDYRTFFVHGPDTRQVNRFTAGLTFRLR